MASLTLSSGGPPPATFHHLTDSLVHIVSSFLPIQQRCLTLAHTSRQTRSHLLSSPNHPCDPLLLVSPALLRSLRQPDTSPQYAQYVSSLPLSLCVTAAVFYDGPSPLLKPILCDEFVAACGLPAVHSRPQSIKDYEAEADEDKEDDDDDEEDFDAPAEEQYASFHRKKDKPEYGEPLAFSSASALLQTALRGLTRLVLRHVSVPLADLALLLSGAPRLRTFICNQVQHMTPAALLLLARCCPLVEHISLINPVSAVLSMTEERLDAAEEQLEQLQPPSPAPPAECFTSLRLLEVRLANYDTDIDEAGFAMLMQLLADAPLQWLSIHTMASLPAASFSLLSRFTTLQGLDMTCCCRPAVYVLLYGNEKRADWDDTPDVPSLYTEPTDTELYPETARCTRHFLSPAARTAFFEAVASLPTTPDDRAVYLEARETDIDEWPKGEIDFLMAELPRERRRRHFYGESDTAFDSEDE